MSRSQSSRAPSYPLLLACVLLVSLWQASRAEQSSEAPPPIRPYNPLENASFGVSLSGDFDADLSLDAVVLDGSKASLMISPASFITAVRPVSDSNDIARLDGSLPDGRDSVLSVGPGGLQEFRWDDPNRQWIELDRLWFGWGDARRVCVGELDGLPGQDVVALASEAANPKKVLVAMGDGSGNFTPTNGFSSFLDAYGLELLDWDGDGTDEVLVLSDYGCEVYEPDGAYVADMAWALPLIAAPIQQSGSSAEQVALIGRYNGNDWFRVWGQAGSEPAINFGPLETYAVSAADLDGDQDSDVILAVNSQTALLKLVNLSENSGQPTFDGTTEVLTFGDQGRDPSVTQAGVAFGDFDDDGDVDILAPAQGSGTIPSRVEIIRGSGQDHTQWQPNLTAHDWIDATREVSTSYGRPATLLSNSGQTLSLEATVWRAPDVDQPTDPTPYQEATYLGVPAVGQSVEFLFTPPASFSRTSTDVFSIVVRQVVRDAGSGEILTIGPALPTLFASEANAENIKLAPGAFGWRGLGGSIPSSWPGGGTSVGPTTGSSP